MDNEAPRAQTHNLVKWLFTLTSVLSYTVKGPCSRCADTLASAELNCFNHWLLQCCAAAHSRVLIIAPLICICAAPALRPLL